jgi:rhodanese-related sulfurtransferase
VIVSIPEIDVEALTQLHGAGAVIIDVREPDEYRDAHVVGARLIPLGEVTERVDEIPDDQPVYVVCMSGGRSARAVEWLIGQGIDATNVVGGTKAWLEAGKPAIPGDEPGSVRAG